jgi:hypothetical protein
MPSLKELLKRFNKKALKAPACSPGARYEAKKTEARAREN